MVSASSPPGGAPAAPIRATSAAPVRTCSTSQSELPSTSAISMPGWARWNAARASNSGATVQAVTIPTTIRPASSPVTSSTAWRTAAAAASAARACGRAAAPAAVSVATRPDRSIRDAPRSRSSWRTCALTPDWLTWTRSAARVKFASSATATKYSSCLNSITTHSSFEKKYLLDFLTSPRPGWAVQDRRAARTIAPVTRNNRRRGQPGRGTEDHAWPARRTASQRISPGSSWSTPVPATRPGSPRCTRPTR